MTFARTGLLVLLSTLAISSNSWAAPGSLGFKKVLVVVLENTDYSKAAQQPFLAQLIKGGAVLSRYFAVTHPSQPNYIAMVSGSTQGVLGDFNVDVDATHLGDLLEARGKSWKNYAEDYPGNCFLGATSDTYARKHVPFLSFKNVQNNPARCARIVNSSDLARDVAAGTLPDFSLYSPGLDDDGHDTDVAYADRWLAKTFGPLIKDARFMQDMLLVVTFDEGTTFGTNQILTVLYGSGVKPGSSSNLSYNHYSLLRTIESGFELGDLGRSDGTAQAITGIWQ